MEVSVQFNLIRHGDSAFTEVCNCECTVYYRISHLYRHRGNPINFYIIGSSFSGTKIPSAEAKPPYSPIPCPCSLSRLQKLHVVHHL